MKRSYPSYVRHENLEWINQSKRLRQRRPGHVSGNGLTADRFRSLLSIVLGPFGQHPILAIEKVSRAADKDKGVSSRENNLTVMSLMGLDSPKAKVLSAKIRPDRIDNTPD